MLSALVIKIRNERGGFPASLCVPGVNACGTVCVAHTFCYIWKIEAFPPTKKKKTALLGMRKSVLPGFMTLNRSFRIRVLVSPVVI